MPNHEESDVELLALSVKVLAEGVFVHGQLRIRRDGTCYHFHAEVPNGLFPEDVYAGFAQTVLSLATWTPMA